MHLLCAVGWLALGCKNAFELFKVERPDICFRGNQTAKIRQKAKMPLEVQELQELLYFKLPDWLNILGKLSF